MRSTLTIAALVALAACGRPVLQGGEDPDARWSRVTDELELQVLSEAGSATDAAGDTDAALTVVPTFESAGLYLDAARDGRALVRYRRVGGDWRRALSMDYDPRDRQYRSSLIGLQPGTGYEAAVMLGGRVYLRAFETWRETDRWPIGKETRATGALVITESGTPAGYHRVTGTTVEGGDICVRVEADYVIVRGFRCIGQSGSYAPMRVLNGHHDILIEDNEITGWGNGGKVSSWHGNAIMIGPAAETTNARVVVQYNYIHDPGWGPTPDERNGSRGPKGITARNVTGGNYVFRYNTIVGSDKHFFGDAIGGGENSDLAGFPGPDSDIYGNYVSHCVDDCIESEGGGMNVRIWKNWLGHYAVAIAVAIVSRGPSYVFRNVLGPARGLGGDTHSGPLKVGGNRVCSDCGDDWHGRHYVFHNTFVSIPGVDGSSASQGNHWGGTTRAQTTRNNIFDVDGRPLADDYCGTGDQDADLDYDLWRGTAANHLLCGRIQEANGIEAAPDWSAFTSQPAPGQPAAYTLRSDTPGHDDGVMIPNFSDGYLGEAPDRGAQEAGAPPMCFGHPCRP